MTSSNHRLSYVKARFAKINEDGPLADQLAGRGHALDGEALALRGAPGGEGLVSLTTLGSAYAQNFDTLANTGTSSTLPTDWFISETGTSVTVNGSYTAGTGSLNTGDTYSFGAAASAERALGQVRSGTFAGSFGATFTNNTGATVTSLQISYVGEQWRFGGVHTTIADKMDFQISFDATSLTTGTWIDVNALDFLAPIVAGTVGPLDGNLAANRTALSFNLTSLGIANGATFWIRWVDVDATGADDGLGIDDFSITPNAAPGLPVLTINDVSMSEGNAGTTTFTFTVSLNAPRRAGRRHLRHRHCGRHRDDRRQRLCRQEPDQPDDSGRQLDLFVQRHRQRRPDHRAQRDLLRQRHQRHRRDRGRRPGPGHDHQ